MEVDGEDEAVVVMDKEGVGVKAVVVEGEELKESIVIGEVLEAEVVKGGEMEVDGEDKDVGVMEEVVIEGKTEQVEGGVLKKLSESGEGLKVEEFKSGELGVENQSSNHIVKLKVDGEDKAVVGIEEVKEVEGGELKKLSEVGRLLVTEEVKGGEMTVEKKKIMCKKKVGRGTCKHTANNGEEFCEKHTRLENKSRGTKHDGKSKVNDEEVEDAMNAKNEEKDEGESSLREEEVPEKGERKRMAAGKESDGSEFDIGRRIGSRRRKDPAVDFEKYLEEISENCHQCQRHDKGGVVRCKSCKKKRYCIPCASRWYSLSFAEIAERCPFCRKNCNCKACLRSDIGDQQIDTEQENEKHQLSKYLIPALLPHLRQLYDEQQSEKILEAEIKGILPYQLHVKRAHCWEDEQVYCNYCRTSIVDYHRSCSKCSFDLCLACCREVRDGSIKKNDKEVHFQCVDRGKDYIHGEVTNSETFKKTKPVPVSPKGKKVASSSWRASENGCIPCPPAVRGGCGSDTLDLHCVLPDDTVADLVNDAEMASFIRGLNDEAKSSLKHCSCFDDNGCSVTNNETFWLCSAACRDDSIDNNLYCPTVKQLQGAVDHFQSHWHIGQPVIVRNALENSSGLSWEPMVMRRALRQVSKMDKDPLTDVTVRNCLDWQEDKVNINQFFNGYWRIPCDEYGWPQLLKLENWPPSNKFEEMLPRHSAEFLSCLPLTCYTHPKSAYWNLATKLPHGCLKPDMGPKMYVAYGVTPELERGDSVTKLHSDITDAVYLLTHADNSGFCCSTKLYSLDEMKEKHRTQDMMELYGGMEDSVNSHSINGSSKSSRMDEESVKETEGAAIWDVFRRQDVPKLQEYLRKHHLEFRHIHCNPVYEIYHPIHDHSLYLSSKHKKNLKEEFGIEPWTFTQKLGDAVFIPAGCPNQVRNVKSCTKVAVDFLSPESIGESLRLVEEFRQLPNNHEAKENKLEVKKILIHAMSKAIGDLMGTNNSDSECLLEQHSEEKKKKKRMMMMNKSLSRKGLERPFLMKGLEV